MGRFSADNSIEKKRFDKQEGRCALWANYEKGTRGAWQAHHINGDNKDHRIGNCAVVCLNCHLYKAHSGDFVNGRLLPKHHFVLNY
jgi:hypothetical protein